MGNCTSTISQDRLLSLEEFMKNATSTEKGKARHGFDILTGGTYTRIHSIAGILKTEAFALLQTGM